MVTVVTEKLGLSGDHGLALSATSDEYAATVKVNGDGETIATLEFEIADLETLIAWAQVAIRVLRSSGNPFEDEGDEDKGGC